MPRFDDHVAGGGYINEGALAGVALEEPGGDRDVVLDILVEHGDGALELEQVRGAAVVVGEGASLGSQPWVVLQNNKWS